MSILAFSLSESPKYKIWRARCVVWHFARHSTGRSQSPQDLHSEEHHTLPTWQWHHPIQREREERKGGCCSNTWFVLCSLVALTNAWVAIRCVDYITKYTCSVFDHQPTREFSPCFSWLVEGTESKAPRIDKIYVMCRCTTVVSTQSRYFPAKRSCRLCIVLCCLMI